MSILRPPSVKLYALILPAALSPDVPFPPLRATALLSNNFHSSASEIEIQVPKSVHKPKAVVVVAAVLSDQAKFSEFAESVKRRELSIQSTNGALANALNWSYLDSNVTRVSWQLMMARPKKKKEIGGEGGNLRIHVFRSHNYFRKLNLSWMGAEAPKEMDALVRVYSYFASRWCEGTYHHF
ncbi:hypothetical protein ACFX19_037699 [Malus domestica]